MPKDPFAPPVPFGDGADFEIDRAKERFQLEPKKPVSEVLQPRAPLTGGAPTALRANTGQQIHSQKDERYHGVVAEEALQRKLLIWTPPLVFLLGFLFMRIGGDSFVRIFFGMWLHELGHASCAWVTGYWAVPGPWRTSIGAEQSFAVTLTLIAICGYAGFRAWHSERKPLTYVACGLAVLILVLTYGVSETNARTAITFFGDGGMMIYGGALVLTFWAPVGSHIHTSWLRWGFIVIGSLAYLDGVFTWWPARKDPSVIPYGEIEGVGLSDPTKLLDVAGWSQQELIDRHVYVIVVVAVVLLARWAYGVWQTTQEER